MLRIAASLLSLFLVGSDEEQKALQGRWTLVSAAFDGMAIPDDAAMGRLVIEGDRYSASVADQRVAATFRLGSGEGPKPIDFTYTEGPLKGETIKAIYELRGDTLRICRGIQPDAERPTEFSAPADSGRGLVVWERDKPAAEDKAKAIEAELKRFAGSWRYESTIVEGKEVPGDALEDVRLNLEGDRFEMASTSVTYRGTFVVDPTATPKTIDVTFSEGPEKGKVSKGIYELDGDTYKVCVGLAGRDRPKTFTCEPGSGSAVQILKRVNP
jgi:uncharacterized protein (TIGR03067 family)